MTRGGKEGGGGGGGGVRRNLLTLSKGVVVMTGVDKGGEWGGGV